MPHQRTKGGWKFLNKPHEKEFPTGLVRRGGERIWVQNETAQFNYVLSDMGISQVNISVFIIVTFFRGQGRRVGELPTASSPFLPLGHKGRTGGRFRPAGFPSLRIPTGCCGGGVRVDAGHVPLLEIVIAVSSENTVKYGTV